MKQHRHGMIAMSTIKKTLDIAVVYILLHYWIVC